MNDEHKLYPVPEHLWDGGPRWRPHILRSERLAIEVTEAAEDARNLFLDAEDTGASEETLLELNADWERLDEEAFDLRIRAKLDREAYECGRDENGEDRYGRYDF